MSILFQAVEKVTPEGSRQVRFMRYPIKLLFFAIQYGLFDTIIVTLLAIVLGMIAYTFIAKGADNG